MIALRTAVVLVGIPALVIACSTAKSMRGDVPPPIPVLDGSAYQAATRVELPKVPPAEEPGLHNVFSLGENIVSGSEPHGEEAFEKLHAMGIRTILSVDGKVPDAELAAKYGMSYVHVPIQYSGIKSDEVLQIAKTFREKEGPFYVHCFHGKHRGPAAAEIGRLVLDGIPREQAIAEMRQWCGTAENYEGLYQTVATGQIPSSEQTKAFAWDFPAAHPVKGFRQGMIEVSRADDNLKFLSKNKWQASADHPDVDPVNEAAKLAGVLQRSNELDEIADKPADFRQWMTESVAASMDMRDALERLARKEGTVEAADAAYKKLSASCNACHAVYRNE